jgi:hypothetical protein
MRKDLVLRFVCLAQDITGSLRPYDRGWLDIHIGGMARARKGQIFVETGSTPVSAHTIGLRRVAIKPLILSAAALALGYPPTRFWPIGPGLAKPNDLGLAAVLAFVVAGFCARDSLHPPFSHGEYQHATRRAGVGARDGGAL